MLRRYVNAGAVVVALGYAVPTLAADAGVQAAPAQPVQAAAVAQPAQADEGKAKPALKHEKKLREHLEKHQKYPATKAELIKSCKGMKDIGAADKEWFKNTLPDGTYKSAQEVLKALGL